MDDRTRREADKLSSTADTRLHRCRDPERDTRERTNRRPGRHPGQGRRSRGIALPLPPLLEQRLRLRAQHRPGRLRGRGHHTARLRETHDRHQPLRAPCGALLALAAPARPQRGRSITCATRTAMPCEEIRLGREETRRGRRRSARHADGGAGHLPEEQRNVLVLRHLVGLTPGEIAERMGKSGKLDPWPTPPRPRVLQTELSELGRGTHDKRKGTGMSRR